MAQDGLCLRFGQDGAEGGGVSLLDGADAAEMLEQTLAGAFADAGDFQQFGFAVAHLAALAMESDGEAVGFVADHLHQVQHGRVAVEHDGIVFLAEDVDDLFFLGDGGERLVGDAQIFEGLGGGVKLAQAAVDEDQAGKRLVFVTQAPVAACDHLAHGGKIVHAAGRCAR